MVQISNGDNGATVRAAINKLLTTSIMNGESKASVYGKLNAVLTGSVNTWGDARAKLNALLAALPSISLVPGNVSHVEGNTGTTVYAFTATRSVSSGTASATWTLSGAIDANDVAAMTGTVSFMAGEVSKTINILVNGDITVENDETFTITLSAPSAGYVFGSNISATGTIVNDDGLMPAASDLIMDYRAENITSVADGATVNSLTDAKSGFVATRAYGAPQYNATGAFGKPSIYFDGASAISLGRPADLIAAIGAQEVTIAVIYLVPPTGKNAQYAGPFGQFDGNNNAGFQGTNGYAGSAPFRAGAASAGYFAAGSLVVHVKTATRSDLLSNPGLPIGREWINGTGGGVGGLNGAAVEGSKAFGLGCAEIDSASRFGDTSDHIGHIIAVQAWDRSLKAPEIITLTKYWFAKMGQPSPWSTVQRYKVYLYNSIWDLNAYATDYMVGAYSERFLGRPGIGGHMSLTRPSGATLDIKAIIDREIPGLSAALGKQIDVVFGQWGNGQEDAGSTQAMIDAVKIADPAANALFVTTTDLGGGDDGTGHATEERGNEAQRKAYNSYWYNANNPRGIQNGRTGLDLVIPMHLNPKMGLPGTSFGPEKLTYFADTVHPTGGIGTTLSGHRTLGFDTIGPALQAAGFAA